MTDPTTPPLDDNPATDVQEISDENVTSVIDRLADLREIQRHTADEIDRLEAKLSAYATKAERKQIEGTAFVVKVSSTETASLPPAGSEARKQLEAQLRDLNLWDRCTVVNAARVKKLLGADELGEPERDLLRERLTIKTSTRLSYSRRKGKAGKPPEPQPA